MLRRHPARLQIDEHLAAFRAGRTAEGQVDLAREHDLAFDRPAHARLDRRCRTAVERRKTLLELDQLVDGETPQVGQVGLAEALDPVADAGVLVGEASEGLVDDVGGHWVATPVHHQLDGAVGDLAAGNGG